MNEENTQKENSSDTPNGSEGSPGEVSETSQCELDLEKTKKDYLYLLAEFDNYRKHAIKERSELSKYGSERIVKDLLEVMDNFDRALKMDLTAENQKTFKSGVEMIFHEMRALLQRNGVSELESLGKPFDPLHHEALSSEPTAEMPPGHVSQVFKRAYKMHDRLIRPAQVVVSVEPQKN